MGPLGGLSAAEIGLIVIAVFVVVLVWMAVRIVPQSEKHVVERFGRLRAVLGPGINFIVPFLDVVRAQGVDPRTAAADRTRRTRSPPTTCWCRWTPASSTGSSSRRRRSIASATWTCAIATTVAGIVRSEIGRMELDTVQSNRSGLIAASRSSWPACVDDWGIEVTRAEILDVNLDEATRAAMLQQLNAERARRAQVTEAEGRKRAVELQADAELYAAEQAAKAKRVRPRPRPCHRGHRPRPSPRTAWRRRSTRLRCGRSRRWGGRCRRGQADDHAARRRRSRRSATRSTC